jgi:glycosyltransferase involved in cell wall biosynthesis
MPPFMTSRATPCSIGSDAARNPLPRPPVSFIAWSEGDGRTIEIAAALGGEARCFYDLAIVRRPLVPIRYALSAARTIVYLIRRRPAAVIVTNPPIFPALIALAYGRIANAPLLLDSHPSAFSGSSVVHRVTRIHAWVVRRVVSTLVTVDELGDIVREWGGCADIIHEAPPQWSLRPSKPLSGQPRVLYIGRFSGDEPTEEVIAAARLTPDIDIHVTGDVRMCPPELRAYAPPNVTFTGYLRGDVYRRAIEEADIVLVLTRRVEAVTRAAYEAVYGSRPLVLTGSPVHRALFPYCVPVSNDAEGIARGLQDAVARHAELVAAAPRALALQTERWDQQLAVLRSRLETRIGA